MGRETLKVRATTAAVPVGHIKLATSRDQWICRWCCSPSVLGCHESFKWPGKLNILLRIIRKQKQASCFLVDAVTFPILIQLYSLILHSHYSQSLRAHLYIFYLSTSWQSSQQSEMQFKRVFGARLNLLRQNHDLKLSRDQTYAKSKGSEINKD